MSRARLRRATRGDLAAYGAGLPEGWCAEGWMLGYALEQDDQVAAYGIVTQDRYGRLWGWFSRRAAVSPFMMHRKARELLAIVRDAGEPAVWAICHPTIPGAATWLERLGFVLTGDAIEQGQIWRCDL